MLLDFRESAVANDLQADICIIGGGAAGIAIAREFIGSRWSVIVLESGGLEFEERIQDFNRGENTRGDFELDESRFRLAGGTTMVWGGWCTPLDELDFEQRSWVPYSGWPAKRHDLLPFYARAQALCELGSRGYELAEWPSLAGTTLALDPAKLSHRLWQLSPPTRFGAAYVPELRRAGNIKLVLHATATEILTSANAAVVQEVRIAGASERRGRVRARSYVVACGGIETPRLMLLSNRVESAGLANGNDLVGCFFMEHPHPDAGGVFIDGDSARFRPYVERNADGAQIVLGLGPSAAAQQRLQILNSSVAVHDSLHVPPSEGWDSLTKLARAADEWRWPDSAGTHIYRVLRDLDDVILEGYRRSRDRPIQGYSFIARTETAPNPANRVTLSADRDALDQPRARLDWRLGTQERRSVQQTMMLLAAEFGRLGVGRVRFNELLLEDDARWSENLSWFGHHMGTTRMSEDPASGVVNPDCRVHGLANLYVAGSSVFPTSGFANPTLTLLALALRLADHLKGLKGDATL